MQASIAKQPQETVRKRQHIPFTFGFRSRWPKRSPVKRPTGLRNFPANWILEGEDGGRRVNLPVTPMGDQVTRWRYETAASRSWENIMAWMTSRKESSESWRWMGHDVWICMNMVEVMIVYQTSWWPWIQGESSRKRSQYILTSGIVLVACIADQTTDIAGVSQQKEHLHVELYVGCFPVVSCRVWRHQCVIGHWLAQDGDELVFFYMGDAAQDVADAKEWLEKAWENVGHHGPPRGALQCQVSWTSHWTCRVIELMSCVYSHVCQDLMSKTSTLTSRCGALMSPVIACPCCVFCDLRCGSCHPAVFFFFLQARGRWIRPGCLVGLKQRREKRRTVFSMTRLSHLSRAASGSFMF